MVVIQLISTFLKIFGIFSRSFSLKKFIFSKFYAFKSMCAKSGCCNLMSLFEGV